MQFRFKIEQRALNELQKQIDYYNELQKGLGKKYKEAVSQAIKSIKTKPFYQVRYDNVRCFPIKRFPFMLHFTIDETEKTIFLHSIINTSQNPETNWLK